MKKGNAEINWRVTSPLSILLISSIFSGADFLLSKPRNEAVIAGQRAEMECRTDRESKVISWQFTSAASRHITSPKTLVSIVGSNVQLGENVSSSFGVDLNENGSGLIYFNSTTTQDSGIYICEVERRQNIIKFSAQLIVFESEPICESNLIENSNLSINDSIWMRCNVAFRGNWTPTVEWRQHSRKNGTNEEEGTPVTYGNPSIVINDSSIQSTLTLTGESAIDGSVYSFNVFFIWPNGSIRTNATNIPKLNLRWKTFSVHVVVPTFTTAISSPARTMVATTDTSFSAPSSTSGLGLSEYLSLLVIGFAIVLIIVTLFIAVFCWVIVRKRTAEWMANIVSTYEDRRTNRNSTISHRYRWSRHSNNTATRENNRMTIGGYSEPYDCRPECSDGYNRPKETNSDIPSYGKVKKGKKENFSEGISFSDSVTNRVENEELYATLRKDIEPPKCYSLYASGDCDSSGAEDPEPTTTAV